MGPRPNHSKCNSTYATQQVCWGTSHSDKFAPLSLSHLLHTFPFSGNVVSSASWPYVLVLCIGPARWPHAWIPCFGSVLWFGALVLCAGPVRWVCALVTCIGSACWFHVLVPHTGSVRWFCALVLCIGSVHWFHELGPCAGSMCEFGVMVAHVDSASWFPIGEAPPIQSFQQQGALIPNQVFNAGKAAFWQQLIFSMSLETWMPAFISLVLIEVSV